MWSFSTRDLGRFTGCLGSGCRLVQCRDATAGFADTHYTTQYSGLRIRSALQCPRLQPLLCTILALWRHYDFTSPPASGDQSHSGCLCCYHRSALGATRNRTADELLPCMRLSRGGIQVKCRTRWATMTCLQSYACVGAVVANHNVRLMCPNLVHTFI